MKKQRALLLLFFIVVLGVGLRSYELTARSLWFDEAFSWRLIQFSFSEMIARAAADVHPPLYYIFLRGWTEVFGSTLAGIRSFSVVMAGATIIAAYVFTSYAVRQRTAGVIAAALLAVSGWQASFAWEARMYTVGTFLALISSWLLLKALRRQEWVYWILYAITAAVFAYTHYFAFFTLFAHALFVVVVLINRTRWRLGEVLQSKLFWQAVVAAVLAVATYVPWIPVFIAQNSQVQESYWVPPIGGWSIPDTFYRMVLPTPGIPSHTGIGIVTTMIPIIATIVLWAALARRREDRKGNWFIVMLGAVPFLLAIAISFIGQSLYQDRFLVFANIFIFIALAVVLAKLSSPWRGWVTGAFLILLSGTFWMYWQELDIANRPGAAAATQQARLLHGGEAPIVVTSPFIYFAVIHYLEEGGAREVGKLYSETGELLHFAGGPILKSDDIIGPDIFSSDATSLVLVETSGFGGSKLPLPPAWRVIEEHTYPEVFTHQADVFVRKIER